MALILAMLAAVVLGMVGLAAAVVLVAGLVQLGDVWNLGRRRRRDAFADGLHLERSGASMSGHVDGHRVSVREIPRGQAGPPRVYLRVWPSIQLQGALTFAPTGTVHSLLEAVGKHGLDVGDTELEERIRIEGVEDTAGTVLLAPRVRDRLARTTVDTPAFDGTALRSTVVGVVGDEIEDHLRELCALASDMDAAATRHWVAAVDRFGLALADDACELSGTVEGRDVRIRVLRHGEGLRTEVAIRLTGRLPPDTRITRDGEDGVRLGDPVLDGNLCVQGDPEVLRPLLCTDAGRAALMTVLHARPEGELTANHLAFSMSGRVCLGLEQALLDALNLADQVEPPLLGSEPRVEAVKRAASPVRSSEGLTGPLPTT